MDDLRALGEFGLLRRILARLPEGGVVVGPGDDAAVLEERDGRALLATADLLVEGRHFDLAFSSHADVGFKAMAVNASDIAAMAGRPLYALVSLGVPASSSPEALEALYDGLAEAARAFGVTVAGGDVVGADQLIVNVAMLGEASAPILRSGARAGDVLCVTGVVGEAVCGLAAFRAASSGGAAWLEKFPNLAHAHRRGRARVGEGRAAGARAMIDVSDGLFQDAGHLCEMSRCGAVIDPSSVPLGDGVREVAEWLGEDPALFALRGGDDYELAMAVPEDDVERARAAIAPTPLTVVGRFTEGDGVTLPDGSTIEGWDHFA